MDNMSQRGIRSAGQPIGRLMAQALQFPDLISLAAGFVDNGSLPCEESTACMQRLLADPGDLRAALQYGSTAGYPALRSAIIDWTYAKAPECKPPVEQVILTSGSNQLLHLLAEALLDPGDIVLAAAPTYFVFLGTLQAAGARTIGIHADEQGMCLDSLQAKLDELSSLGLAHRVKAIYVIPDFDNPGASTLSLERRHELLHIAMKWRSSHGPLMLIVDNAYQQLRYEGESLPTLRSLHPEADDFIAELGTFSKSFSPGIRVGWGVVPEYLVEPLLDIKSNIDFGSPHFAQHFMYRALIEGEVERHLPRIRTVYQKKLQAMLTALQAEMGDIPGVHWRKPSGGLYVWLTLPEHISASEGAQLWQIATQYGVLYVPGDYCYPAEGQAVEYNTIRLSFGVQSPEGIAVGIQKLAQAVREVI